MFWVVHFNKFVTQWKVYYTFIYYILYIDNLQLDTGNTDLTVPDIKLEMFPKEAFTAGKNLECLIMNNF